MTDTRQIPRRGGSLCQADGCLARTLGALVAVGALVATPAATAQVSDQQVQRAIDRGVEHLRSSQGPDGHWKGQFPGGATALSVLALKTAGLRSDDPAIVAGTRALLNTNNVHTYVVALKAMALAAVDAKTHAVSIQQAANDLAAGQFANGTWSYMSPAARRGNFNVDPVVRSDGQGDNSNTQFALLGLYEARRAGARVPPEVFRLSDDWFRKTQNSDGSWSYSGRNSGGTNTMTAAGVASLFITAGTMTRTGEAPYDLASGSAARCGSQLSDVHLSAGLAWLDRAFQSGPGAQNLYWFYAFERVGVLTGQRYLGGQDWFAAGAERLVRSQGPDGSWARGNAPDNAFALLFLVKGRLPVIVNKLKYRGEWNPDADDIKHLTAFCSIEKVFEDAVGWQTVTDTARLEQWSQAPVLYINGHEFPDFDKATVEKFRRYTDNGGTVVFEACCSRPAFDAGFRRFAQAVWPDYPLTRLDMTHPVFHSHYDLTPKPQEGRPLPVVFGIDTSCRTSVLYLPRDVSCLWQQAALNHATLGQPTRAAFELGANILAYASGKEPLRGRLERVELPGQRVTTDLPTSRGAVQIAQLRHTGDWRPCANAVLGLAVGLRDRAGVDIVGKPEAVNPDEPTLFNHPVAFMTGHTKFELDDAQRAGLKQYLQRGGFIIAESCCGRAAFDESFRAMIAATFPETPDALKPVPLDHPLITGKNSDGTVFGFAMHRVRYRKRVLAEQPLAHKPVLWMIEIEGRPALVYSPYSLGCGLDGMTCVNCRGVEAEDAKKLAINIVLYALSR